MSDHNHQEQQRTDGTRAAKSGQAMVEYVLIAVLVGLAVVLAISVTGPAVGNIFSNQVWNLLGQTVTPYTVWDDNKISTYAKFYGDFTPMFFTFEPNTPSAPTCSASAGIFVTPDANGEFTFPTVC
jgi:Flp pilus assembly pilin Flp